MSTSTTYNSAFTETVSGITAGTFTTVIVHPLDLLKLRLQVDRSRSSPRGNALRITKRIFRDEGGIRALYRGLVPNVVGNSASWALYFLSYDMSKGLISRVRGDYHHLSYYDFFAASSIAGIATAVCTNPIWVIKTRMLSTSTGHNGAYTSMNDGVRQIYHQEGLTGFYRGLLPSLFGVGHGALQFMAYEKMKQTRSNNHHGTAPLSNWDYLLFGGTSKAFAGTITYPIQVIRSRLQTYDADKHYAGMRDVIIQTLKREGVYGFYKGLGTNLFRVVPSSCITFLAYENTKHLLFRPGA